MAPLLFDACQQVPLCLGLLRLCTDGRPSEVEAIAVIHAALDAGIRLLDTADAYCLTQTEMHYGEKLARQAVESWKGPQKEVRILTKAGMTRPKGKWVPNGKPEHLRKAIDGSLKALGVDRLFMLQLHVHDNKVPFEETLAALAVLQQQGKVEHLGLCNTTVAEIQQAQRHFKVMVVQNELSLQVRKTASDGTLAFTQEQQIPFLAYRPLGGTAKVEKLAAHKALQPLADRHSVSPLQVALASVRSAGKWVIPLFGATKVASVQAAVQSLRIPLDENDHRILETKFSMASKATPMPLVVPAAAGVASAGGEVILIMGVQGAGKSELVASYVDQGFARLNRDVLGGKLEDLVLQMHALIQSGQRSIVLDNTYPTRISRAPVIAAARLHGIPVRCIYLNTPLSEARINVALRMIAKYGRSLGPDEMKQFAKTDPNLPPPSAQKRWADTLETPQLDEGFSKVEEIAFVRRHNASHQQAGLMLDVDGTLRRTKSGEIYPREADDVELLPGRQTVLQKYVDQGYQLFFISNQSGIASGKVTQQAADAAFARTIDLLQLPVKEVAYCPHPAFPVGCYCRKPLPGMGVYLMQKYQLDHKKLIVVGDLKSDAEFAAGLQAKYVDGEAFFAS